ncbi:MAG TPA: hypothetical protein VHC22_16155 [Pirellulales bacterium]|nr:hypothetical protein [Pirellulales bacterium]
MIARFQFSLGRLLAATAFLSVSSASISVFVRHTGPESSSVALPIIVWSFTAAICILIGDRRGTAIMVGAMLVFIGLGFLLA